jgi:hypothetical protein
MGLYEPSVLLRGKASVYVGAHSIYFIQPW